MSGPRVQVGLDWSPSPDLQAAFDGICHVDDVLQVTVEQAFRSSLPERYTTALDTAAERGNVVAHAVLSSPYTAPRDSLTQSWAVRTHAVLQRWPARWLIDHVGCCRANGWNAAPIPLPPSRALVGHVQEHLRWMHQEFSIPVGLENLALAVSRDDVLIQPDLVDQMLRPVDGILLLDLHNLWCQAVNFDFDPVSLLQRWPLDRVRQLHIAGGSWSGEGTGRFRRDTHDGEVPDAVWSLLDEALKRCGRVEVVTLERLGGTLVRPDELIADLQRLRAIRRPTPLARRAPDIRPSDADLAWRDEPPVIGHAVFAALQAGDREALNQAAPGWWQDDRAFDVAVELTKRWGRSAPL